MTDRQKVRFAALALMAAGFGLIVKPAYAAPPVWLEVGDAAPTDGYLLSVDDATKCAQSSVDLRRCQDDLGAATAFADADLAHCQELHRIDKGALNVCRSKLLDPERGRPEVIRETRWGLVVGAAIVGAFVGGWAMFEVRGALD